jgi:hypothetical protein
MAGHCSDVTAVFAFLVYKRVGGERILPGPARNISRAFQAAAVTCFLLALLVQLAMTARATSITWDEDDHIFAGYMSWKTGDFGLNPEHPPLVKLLAAALLLPMTLSVPALQGRPFKIDAFLSGKDFVFKNDTERILFRARMAAALLTVLLALLVFLAAQEMFGTGAGFIALALFVFDPNVLAHGAVVGTDMGLSCFLLAAIYAFYRYAKAPSGRRLAVTGIAAGLALASKHTAILVFPMLLLLAAYEVWRQRGTAGERGGAAPGWMAQGGRMALALAAIGVIAIGLLWASYGFRYAARPEGLAMNPPTQECFHNLSRPRETRLLETVAHWKLLPESYLYGLADVRSMSDFYTSYLLGTVYPHGVVSYFPIAFSIKATLPLLILLLAALVLIVRRRMTGWREIVYLTVPSVLYLLVAMFSRMNIGLRHILPMYVLLTVLAAGAAWTLVQRQRLWVYAVVALLVWQAVLSVRIFPAYMAYANPLWGGPSQTHRLLSDSNVDWGQQLKSVKKYLDSRGINDCWFVYFAEGVVNASSYGIPCKMLPTQDSNWVNEPLEAPPAIDGTVLVSAGDWSGFEYGPPALNPYEVFKHTPPVAMIDYGVLVYEGHFDLPLAAGLSHARKAGNLLTAGRAEEALAEAQQAVALAPDAVKSQAVLGDTLTALKRREEAREAYQKALHLAQTVEPEFQVGWVGGLQHKLVLQ